MTDEQVRTLLPDLLERAAIEEHLADGCNDGSPLEREHLAWAQSLRALADHLGAGLAEREQAARDRADAERWRWLDQIVVEMGLVELCYDKAYWIEAGSVYGCCHSDLRGAIDAAREASRDE